MFDCASRQLQISYTGPNMNILKLVSTKTMTTAEAKKGFFHHLLCFP